MLYTYSMNLCYPYRMAVLAATMLMLAACAAGPDYERPAFPLPAAYKEDGLWKSAQPRDADAGQPWWTRYGDTDLDALVERANAASQDIRIAEAQYRQARAAVQLARAGYTPTLGAAVSASHTRAPTATGSVTTGSESLLLDASWEPDIWGRVRRSVEAGAAAAQAGAADMAAVRLSIQSELVQDYLQLRITDAQKDLLLQTTEEYRKALALTRSQYAAGVVTRTDVALAETLLQSTSAQAIDLGVQRSQLEHAIAILSGRAPAELAIAARPAGALGLTLPEVPAGLPAQLLERRPDIAAAERRAAAANAGIGVARSAYFPSLTLNGSTGAGATSYSQWINAPSRVWSLGAVLAETIFDGGARSAQNDVAVAAYDAAAAQYKRTVLAGLQEVEDNLAALRVLGEERAVQDAAVASASQAARTSLAQYRAGTTSYLAVVTAQTLLLANQRSSLQLLGRQLTASAVLVKALGGGWSAAQLDGAATANALPANTALSPVNSAAGN
ncbi:Outer membrane component of tripartite multidrug resistance system [Georgfuchsia toluolica]|uniref:Outer membrane component of tripartite multidrug resistance system n=1 Tax=Georgfuchsia toluolica TaxID=424218 RepID=A0A916J610_9PROT|nr:efflux transporter outer membrane subunit [Georgfuchsia toluolica]CAG4885189.1 Outer membrane component of tripartite multidrug resistance system [Georgfuchsia toluolica]